MSDELIERLTGYQNTIKEYSSVLASARWGVPGALQNDFILETLTNRPDFMEWLKKVEPLSCEVRDIYLKLQSGLGLPYNCDSLNWSIKDIRDRDGTNVRDKLLRILEGIDELKEARINLGTKTLGAGGGAKPACRWEIDEEKQAVYCEFEGNKYGPVKLSRVGYGNGLLFRLFLCLYRQWKKNKGWVKVSTLEKCWDNKPSYKEFVADAISKLRTTLKEELKKCKSEIEREIIEPDHPKRTTKYRLI